VNAVTTPAFENGADTTSSHLVIQLTFTTTTECTLDIFGIEANYDADSSSVSTGTAEQTTSFTASADNSGLNHPIDSSGGAVTVTLPNITAIGVTLRFTANSTTTNDIQISPDATDNIQGLNLNAGATVDKDFILADPAAGDFIEVMSDGTDTWRVTAAAGVWTREA
jgi:glycerate-2-kinase